MIDRKVFDKVGLLNCEYGTGAGEDIEFCVEAKSLYGNLDQWNIYKKMDEWNWKGSLEDAFRKMYLK